MHSQVPRGVKGAPLVFHTRRTDTSPTSRPLLPMTIMEGLGSNSRNLKSSPPPFCGIGHAPMRRPHIWMECLQADSCLGSGGCYISNVESQFPRSRSLCLSFLFSSPLIFGALENLKIWLDSTDSIVTTALFIGQLHLAPAVAQSPVIRQARLRPHPATPGRVISSSNVSAPEQNVSRSTPVSRWG